MLKDLAVLRSQKTLYFIGFAVLIPVLFKDDLFAALWCLFPIVAFIQNIEALDMKGNGMRLARSLPLSPSEAVGARYLLPPLALASILAVVWATKSALRLAGSPISAFNPGIVILSAAGMFGYYSVVHPLNVALGFMKARWVNMGFIFLVAFSGAFSSVTAKPGFLGAQSAPVFTFDGTRVAAAVARPILALPLLGALAALYLASFLLSCRLWESKELRPEI
jgi:predicted permease